MKKRFFKIISSIMILVTLVASPLYSAELSNSKKIALMNEGENVINDFYNSKSENYFGKKVDAFFADDKNMQRVKSRAEEYAKKNATDTQYITPIYFNEELNNYIFSDLLLKLKKIHDNYSYPKDNNKYSTNSNVGLGGIFVTATGTFATTIGIGAVVLATIGAVNSKLILGFFSYWYIVFLAGGAGAAGLAGAKASLLAGPWGWIVAGALVLATVGGLFYYKWKKASLQREMIKTIKTQIEDKRSELINAWRNSF